MLLLLTLAHAMDCAMPPEARAEFASEALQRGCAFVNMEAAGAGFVSLPAGGTTRGMSLRRANLQLGLRSADRVLVRALMNVVRSGGPDGYIGVAGEALVPAVDVFEARYDLAEFGLSAAAGIVDEPWRMSSQPAWTHLEVAAPVGADRELLARSDLGAWVGWTLPDRLLQVTVAGLSGEGARARERNNGVDLALVVASRPTPQLEVAVHAREGSMGILRSPSHRLGAHALLLTDSVVGGVEGLTGWGVDGDGVLRPTVGSLWVRAGDQLPVAGWARVDAGVADLGTPQTDALTLLLGGGPRLPFRPGANAWITLAYDGRLRGDAAAEMAGAAAATHTVSLTLRTGVAALWDL